MKRTVFVDTSALGALASKDEQYHMKVFEFFSEKYDPNSMRLVTTDYVLDELLTFMRCRKKQELEEVLKFVKSLFVSEIEILGIGKDLFADALTLMATFDDQYFSCTDCVSFMVMKDMKINDVIATDKHFAIAGFNNLLN